MNKEKTLWIFGDSWSALYADYDPERVWTRQLAATLSRSTNENILLRNASLVGSAQDWMFSEYLKVVEEIKPDDYVVIILTSPARYWYFDELPSLSNWNILDFDSQVSKEQAKAVELYIKHIQRPQLDSLSLIGRLSSIAYETNTRGLRRPLIIRGFIQDLGPANYFKELNIAKGELSRVQYDEYKNPELVEEMSARGEPGYFKGADCRFNHLCLRNHDVLVEKLFQGLVNNKDIDLTVGFHSNLIGPDWLSDQELCEVELSHRAIEFFTNDIQKRKFGLPWKRRTGIEQIMDNLQK